MATKIELVKKYEDALVLHLNEKSISSYVALLRAAVRLRKELKKDK
jgi:hypothetical protein